jgi:hypothetical protein
VDFHRNLADAQLCCDLLVEQTIDDEDDHLPVARRQGVEPKAKFRYDFLVVTPFLVSLERPDNVSMSWSRNGVVRTSIALAFMAWTDIGLSP